MPVRNPEDLRESPGPSAEDSVLKYGTRSRIHKSENWAGCRGDAKTSYKLGDTCKPHAHKTGAWNSHSRQVRLEKGQKARGVSPGGRAGGTLTPERTRSTYPEAQSEAGDTGFSQGGLPFPLTQQLS